MKIARANVNNLRYADDTTLMAESEEEVRSLLMKVKQESEKVGLNLNIQKTKKMASGLITSWQIDGETVEIVREFILGGSKTTADGDCSHEVKMLTPWKESFDQSSSVQFSSVTVMSALLQLHEPQIARPPCPSPMARVFQTHVC